MSDMVRDEREKHLREVMQREVDGVRGTRDTTRQSILPLLVELEEHRLVRRIKEEEKWWTEWNEARQLWSVQRGSFHAVVRDDGTWFTHPTDPDSPLLEAWRYFVDIK